MPHNYRFFSYTVFKAQMPVNYSKLFKTKAFNQIFKRLWDENMLCGDERKELNGLMALKSLF